MDLNTLLSSGVSGGIIAVFYVCYKIFKHSSCTSTCCGKQTDLKIDLSPPDSMDSKEKSFI